MIDLIIVIPVYNEESIIGSTIQEWSHLLDALDVNYQIHVYNDGSKDLTETKLNLLKDQTKNLFVHSHSNQGHGPSILMAYNENVNLAEWIFQCDSDGELAAQSFQKLWKKRKEYDFLLGYRFQSTRPFIRRCISKTVQFLTRILFGKGIKDPNIPYRLMKTSIFKSIYQQIPQGTFAPNILISALAVSKRMKIYQIPIEFVPRIAGKSTLSGIKFLPKIFRAFYQTLSFYLAKK